ncbi:unnamed protein product [Closterium sp. NIES-53]
MVGLPGGLPRAAGRPRTVLATLVTSHTLHTAPSSPPLSPSNPVWGDAACADSYHPERIGNENVRKAVDVALWVGDGITALVSAELMGALVSAMGVPVPYEHAGFQAAVLASLSSSSSTSPHQACNSPLSTSFTRVLSATMPPTPPPPR